jgi:hypothetical protein
MTNWPLDGIIGFAVVVGVLGMLIIGLPWAAYRDAKRPPLKPENGFYVMRPGTGARVLLAALLLFLGVIGYGGTQAGFCKTMTAAENASNLRAWLLVFSSFALATLYFACTAFVRKMRFNAEGIFVTPVFGAEQAYLFRDLEDVGVANARAAVFFSGKRRLVLSSTMRLGERQLHNLVNRHVFCMDKPPLVPLYDADAAAQMKGKKMTATIRALDDDYVETAGYCFYGIVVDISPAHILLRDNQGRTLELPANLRTVMPFLADAEEEQEDGEKPHITSGLPWPPDFASLWYTRHLPPALQAEIHASAASNALN